MKLEDIPRREEILILTEAHQRLDRVLVSQHFDRRVASFAEIALSRARCGLARCAARR